MQKFFSKYALAAHLALMTVAPLFLFPFFGVEKSSVVLLWLSFLSILWILLEPSRRPEEYLYNARNRVYKSIISDPLFFIFGLLLIVAFVRWLNNGIKLEYGFVDSDWLWTVSLPTIQWLPGSDSEFGFMSLSTFISVAMVVLACRHALGKSARIMYVFLSALFAGIAAVVAVLYCNGGSELKNVIAISEYKVYSFAGSSFGLFFLASIIALAGMFERGWLKSMLLFSFAAGATFTGLCYFAPSVTIAFYSAFGLLLLLIVLVYVAVRNGSLAFFKCLVALIVAAVLPVIIFQFATPKEVLDVKAAILNSQIISEEFFDVRRMYISLASDVWQSGNIWLGNGVGSLPLYMKLNLAENFWVDFIPDAWWQILTERGLVGLTMIVVPFLFLTYTLLVRIFRAQFKRSFWLLTILGVIVVFVVIIEGFYSASLMRPEFLSFAGALYALSASSLPLKQNIESNQKK